MSACQNPRGRWGWESDDAVAFFGCAGEFLGVRSWSGVGASDAFEEMKFLRLLKQLVSSPTPRRRWCALRVRERRLLQLPRFGAVPTKRRLGKTAYLRPGPID